MTQRRQRAEQAIPEVTASGPCPCGTDRTYAACCAAYVIDGTPPPTAEATMRSRYTAYVVGAADHLLRTWHPRTRPCDVDLAAEGPEWKRLDVIDVVAGEAGDATGEVAFAAHWRAGDDSGVLRERSTFTRRGGRWMYVSGVTS
ncbi:MAG: YchJ family metal-binding protein [Dermatophilaceae bacterium]